MEANLNTGNGSCKMFLCKLIGKPNKSPIDCPFFNGTYRSNLHQGMLTLSLVGWTRGRHVQGAYHQRNQSGEGVLRGIIASTNDGAMKDLPYSSIIAPIETSEEPPTAAAAAAAAVAVQHGPWEMLGMWRDVPNSSSSSSSSSSSPDWNSVAFQYDSEIGASTGIWTKLKTITKTMTQGPWNVIKNDFVQVSFRKDYTTSYQHGVLEFGTRYVIVSYLNLHHKYVYTIENILTLFPFFLL